MTQGGGGVSPNRSPPPSIAAFEEQDEGEEEDAEHEREQEHDGGEDGDSEQLPLSNVGRGGRVGNKSQARVKKNGAAAGGYTRGDTHTDEEYNTLCEKQHTR